MVSSFALQEMSSPETTVPPLTVVDTMENVGDGPRVVDELQAGNKKTKSSPHLGLLPKQNPRKVGM